MSEPHGGHGQGVHDVGGEGEQGEITEEQRPRRDVRREPGRLRGGLCGGEIPASVAKACHAEGVVVLTCGTYGNVLRFLPPLAITDELLDEGLGVLQKAFATTP